VISGLRNRDLRTHIPDSTAHQISRGLKRLRLHGIVKRVPGTFKYYLTDFGRRIVIGSLAIKEMTAIPAIARADAS
jgi:DNA-binding HxlR family transcriptional regulator